MASDRSGSEAFDLPSGDVADALAPANVFAASRAEPAPRGAEGFRGQYLELLSLIERLHRLMLDVIKDEFERIGRAEVNSVQALLLYHIGEEEMTAGDLTARGYYQGSNVSYNLKKLVEAGFLNHQRCRIDRRAVRIRATAKGLEVRAVVSDLFDRHAAALLRAGVIDDDGAAHVLGSMRGLEGFWRERIRFIY